jgi:hypothetical protein
MAIYRKGGDESGLRTHALQQGIEEASATRNMTSSQRYEREVNSGVQGAKNAINLKATVAEATASPTTLGGPVSGAALAKLRAKKSEAKRTQDREKKRR